MSRADCIADSRSLRNIHEGYGDRRIDRWYDTLLGAYGMGTRIWAYCTLFSSIV